MPMKPIPFDSEFMNHPKGTKPLGAMATTYEGMCRAETEVDHEDLDGDMRGWICTREKGHLGRHEGSFSSGHLGASWAPRQPD